MLYCLEQGPVEQNIIRQCVAQRVPLPDKIANAPVINDGLELFYSAFMELSTCRGGMGDGPIPWAAIDAYCARHWLDEETYEDLFFYVRALDHTWLQHQEKKRKAKENASRGRSKNI